MSGARFRRTFKRVFPPWRRTNQNPALLSFGILFYRWHNVLAGRVQAEHPEWSDEDVFQRARRINIATLQNIIAYEYLPAFIGDNLETYAGYRQDVHPGISHVFQSAAFRWRSVEIFPCFICLFPVFHETLETAIVTLEHWKETGTGIYRQL